MCYITVRYVYKFNACAVLTKYSVKLVFLKSSTAFEFTTSDGTEFHKCMVDGRKECGKHQLLLVIE